MCLACEMFWFEAEEPAPARKRGPRRAKGQQPASIACDAPAQEPTKTAKRRGGSAHGAGRRESERRS